MDMEQKRNSIMSKEANRKQNKRNKESKKANQGLKIMTKDGAHCECCNANVDGWKQRVRENKLARNKRNPRFQLKTRRK